MGRSLAHQLRGGAQVSDAAFDAIYPRPVGEASDIFWTPLDVARATIDLIQPTLSTRVLDVGSGAGKFCIAGSLMSAGRFTGIEQDPSLVQIATAAAQGLGADRADLHCGDALELTWSGFDVVYLFNPFQLRIARVTSHVVWSSTTTREVRARRALKASRKLEELPAGTRVVLFHGFGKAMPGSYRKVEERACAAGPLQLWIKRRPRSSAAGDR
jgi:predicted RNA methylase